ncbi:MAG TPA: hypothetical protein VII13_12640 [Vicinamibacteria bacterium]|jgi:hypothetical protein
MGSGWLRRWSIVLTLVPALAWGANEDVYYLLNGDRVSGRTVSKARRSITVQTPFGRLAIPRANLHKVIKADGSEEVFNRLPDPPAVPPARSAPPPAAGFRRPARVTLIVTGQTFWYAWDPKENADPRLRLEVTMDEEPAAVYLDGVLDPDIKGAVVNAFSFAADDVTVEAARGIVAHAPEARPGRIALKLDVPGSPPGERKVRLAYQVNSGTEEEPAWKDLASSSASVFVRPGEPGFLQIRQDRGRMEFSGFPRRRMKNVETFKLELSAE